MNHLLFDLHGAPLADTRNMAGGVAYSLSPAEALAQYAVTGCFYATYYASAVTNFMALLDLVKKNDPTFIAKTAVYAAERGRMKDMPVFFTAWLVANGHSGLAKSVFPRTVTGGKQLRNFVGMLRGGTLGRKSLGSTAKNLVHSWFNARTPRDIFWNSVGSSPSLGDVIKMAHPRPAGDQERENLYGYLIGKKWQIAALPTPVQYFEHIKSGTLSDIPVGIPFEMLVGLNLTERQWRFVAQYATWNQTLKNLNTFQRHGVFKDGDTTNKIVERLRNRPKNAAFPYSVYQAWKSLSSDVPVSVNMAVQDALDHAIDSTPEIPGAVALCVDVSSSMNAKVTGDSRSNTGCREVAALFAVSLLRRNPSADLMLFDTNLHSARLNVRDSIATNVRMLERIGGGGTDCSMPLRGILHHEMRPKTVIYFSDNESWRSFGSTWHGATTNTAALWAKYKSRVPDARLILVDLAPNSTTQAKGPDVLNIGGFSDAVFDLIREFAANGHASSSLVDKINEISL